MAKTNPSDAKNAHYAADYSGLKQWNNLQGNTIAAGNSLIVAKSEVEIVKAETPETFKKKENLASVSKNKGINYYVK